MEVSKRGLIIENPNWDNIFSHEFRYSFHPHFVTNESAALQMYDREIAAAFLRVLESLGIDAEVFETPPPFRPK